MTEREQFEAAMSAYCDPVKVEETFYREGDGCSYESYATMFAWCAWQAARATAEQSRSDAWVSVNARLPDSAAYVIAANKYCVGLSQYWNSAWQHLHGVTHWQPLPTPPADTAIESQRSATVITDAMRINALEAMANQPGGVLLHDGSERGRTGLGLRPGALVRTLREAIDAAIESQRSGDGS